jgi:predicted porin
MNTVRIALIAAFSACAAVAQAQSADPFYRLPQPYTSGIVPPASAGEARFKLKGKGGSLSLGLFEGAAEGPSERLLEYVDPVVERQVGNFSREAVRSASVLESLEPGRFERRNRAWGMSLGFNAGPLAIRAAHQNKHVARVAPAMDIGNKMDAKNSILAVNVDLGGAKVYTAYSANRGWGSTPLWNPDNPYSAVLNTSPSTDSRDLMAGIAVPYGKTTFLASFIRKNDRDLANRDTRQLAFGASHALSRKTDFYTAVSYTTNTDGAGYAIGRRGGVGAGVSAISVGMRHSF